MALLEFCFGSPGINVAYRLPSCAGGEEASPGACALCRDAACEGAAPAGVGPPAALARALALRIAETLRLEGVWDLKPLLAGGEVQAALGLPKAGPALGAWLDCLLTWQLQHPDGAKQDATAWLQQFKGLEAPPAAVLDELV